MPFTTSVYGKCTGMSHLTIMTSFSNFWYLLLDNSLNSKWTKCTLYSTSSRALVVIMLVLVSLCWNGKKVGYLYNFPFQCKQFSIFWRLYSHVNFSLKTSLIKVKNLIQQSAQHAIYLKLNIYIKSEL